MVGMHGLVGFCWKGKSFSTLCSGGPYIGSENPLYIPISIIQGVNLIYNAYITSRTNDQTMKMYIGAFMLWALAQNVNRSLCQFHPSNFFFFLKVSQSIPIRHFIHGVFGEKK